MIEEITPDMEFNLQKFSEDFFIKGVYCFFDKNLKSLVSKNEWVKEYDDVNFWVLRDESASDIAQTIIYQNISQLFNVTVRNTKIFCGIDKISDTWHTDDREKMFCQSLCYQEDLNSTDGGSIRFKCLDQVERYFTPINGSVIIMNHSNGIEHKVDKIISNKKRIVINCIFDLESKK